MIRPALSLLIFSASLGASAASISLNQVDWYLSGVAHPNTEWGAVKVDYTGSDQILYFNLNVNGSWQVQNEPLLSGFGAGNREALEINFNLGNARGTNVASANVGWSITSSVLGSMPAITVSMS